MFDLVSGVSHGLFISFTIYATELDVGNIEWLKVDVFILERFVDFYCNFEFAGLSGTCLLYTSSRQMANQRQNIRRKLIPDGFQRAIIPPR